MNKIIITIVLSLALTPLGAQQAKTVFERMPDSVLPSLTSVNRADFVDFLESDMKAQVKNRFGGISEMTALTDTYIHIRLSDRSEWEMKLLPLNDSVRVVCAVTTVCAPVCDSSVAFYSAADWSPLDASGFIRLPRIDDFFLPVDSARLDEFANFRVRMDMLLMSARLSGSEDTITFTLNTPQYMGSPADEAADSSPDTDAFVRPALVYRWKDALFERVD